MDQTIYGAGLASYPAGVKLQASVYATNHRPAFTLLCADDGMPYGTLTVNVPQVDLAEDEILVSADWNLPADLKAALLATGKFERTGRWNQVGLGRGEVWRVTDTELLATVEQIRRKVMPATYTVRDCQAQPV